MDSHYQYARDYEAPHGRDLQDWFGTSSRIIEVVGNPNYRELWIVTKDGGAILFDYGNSTS